MSIKTVQAKNLHMRVGFAYAGTEKQHRPPTMATAYKRTEGVVTIALVDGGAIEVRNTERVRYSDDPVGDGATHLRWCRTCPEKHLLRVGTDVDGTLYCDVRIAFRDAQRKAEKEGQHQKAWDARRAEHAQRVAERLDTLMAHKPLTHDQMQDVLLRNVAHDMGTESKRFAVVRQQMGLSQQEAVRRALAALDTKGWTDASANQQATA